MLAQASDMECEEHVERHGESPLKSNLAQITVDTIGGFMHRRFLDD